MAEPTQPVQRMVVTHFIVSDDVERSRRFYTEVLGGKVVFGPEPTNIALANNYVIINGGGGPTDDKPTVTLETPSDPDRASSFLNIRVADIHAVYAEWTARGAQFLTPPKQHQYEIRCYIRDPDGYIIEVGQTTDPQGDWWPADRPRRAIRLNPVSSMSRRRPSHLTRRAARNPRSDFGHPWAFRLAAHRKLDPAPLREVLGKFGHCQRPDEECRIEDVRG